MCSQIILVKKYLLYLFDYENSVQCDDLMGKSIYIDSTYDHDNKKNYFDELNNAFLKNYPEKNYPLKDCKIEQKSNILKHIIYDKNNIFKKILSNMRIKMTAYGPRFIYPGWPVEGDIETINRKINMVLNLLVAESDDEFSNIWEQLSDNVKCQYNNDLNSFIKINKKYNEQINTTFFSMDIPVPLKEEQHFSRKDYIKFKLRKFLELFGRFEIMVPYLEFIDTININTCSLSNKLCYNDDDIRLLLINRFYHNNNKPSLTHCHHYNFNNYKFNNYNISNPQPKKRFEALLSAIMIINGHKYF